MRETYLDLDLIHRMNNICIMDKQELRIRPCPVVFAALSGGPKACMYKVFQVNLGIARAFKYFLMYSSSFSLFSQFSLIIPNEVKV